MTRNFLLCVLLDVSQYNHTIMKKKRKRKGHPKTKRISFRGVKASKETLANKFFFNDPLSKFTETHLDGVALDSGNTRRAPCFQR